MDKRKRGSTVRRTGPSMAEMMGTAAQRASAKGTGRANPGAKPKSKGGQMDRSAKSTQEGRSFAERFGTAAQRTAGKSKPKLEEVTVTAKRKPTPTPKAAPAKVAPKAKAAAPKSKFGVGSSKTVMHNGKNMANVTAEQLKASGMSLREYMNQWNKTGARPVYKRTTKATLEKYPQRTTKGRPKN